MKKAFLLIPLLLIISSCAKEAKESLPPLSSNGSSSGQTTTYYHSKLTKSNCGLTGEDSTSAMTTAIDSDEDSDIKYEFEIGAPAYQHSKHDEFVIKGDAYIKSASSYRVERLLIDFFSSKGVFFDVYANSSKSGEPLEPHKSDVAPQDPDDGGLVYEYAVESNGFYIANNTTNNKPAFYSITVIYSI